MIEGSATKLRNHLFEYLKKVSRGETVATVTPPPQKNWRAEMRSHIKLNVAPEKAFAPMDDVWDDYT